MDTEDESTPMSDSERALAASRAQGDFVINSALDWIDRFHGQASESVLTRLTGGIRALSKAMHSRSTDEIKNSIQSLLDIGAPVLLPGSPRNAVPTRTSGASRGLKVPRVHDAWRESDYFAAKQHRCRPANQKHGPVFISYARADSEWLSRVLIHMRPLERAGRIELWHDGKLRPGQPWRQELDIAVQLASAAVLLVSANFMASDFIYANELQPIAKRAKAEGVVVFPVIIGHCFYEADDNLRDLQSFNDPESPLCRLDDGHVDKILVKLAKHVRDLCVDS